ncbi:MAG: hypothetical protein WD250_02805 [Egibacteraceae bacterium]
MAEVVAAHSAERVALLKQLLARRAPEVAAEVRQADASAAGVGEDQCVGARVDVLVEGASQDRYEHPGDGHGAGGAGTAALERPLPGLVTGEEPLRHGRVAGAEDENGFVYVQVDIAPAQVDGLTRPETAQALDQHERTTPSG